MGIQRKEKKKDDSKQHRKINQLDRKKTIDSKSKLKNQKNKINNKEISELKKKKEIIEEHEVLDNIQQDGYFIVPQEQQISKEEEALLNAFMGGNNMGMLEQEIEKRVQQKEQEKIKENILNDPKVKVVYGDVANLMKTYTNGQLSKPFKAIPQLEQWKEVLDLTLPNQWSANATETATKYLMSNLDNYRAQIFLEEYLLPQIRNDIKKEKKLKVHYYWALKKAVYKPMSWFKGILFKLLQEQPTLRECQIVGSVLNKMSIPVMYSSVALLKLLKIENGLAWMFIKIILQKKYALPQRVVTSVYLYLVAFKDEHRQLPVMWHQMLLIFAMHYSGKPYNRVIESLEDLQTEGLKQLIKRQKHPVISEQILKAIEGEYKQQRHQKTTNVVQYDDDDMIVE